MARKLKVFRTAAGFHDAYVAAPSRKAALTAWGSAADLFARGMAEEVTDAALTKAPLERPGEVIRVSRGSADEQLAEAAKSSPVRRRKRACAPARGTPSAAPPRTQGERKPRPRARPKPSRDALAAAEATLAEAEERHHAIERVLNDEQKALDRRRQAARAAYEKTRATCERTIAAERERYDAALARWRT